MKSRTNPTRFYKLLELRIADARLVLKRPLTLAEKLLFGHMVSYTSVEGQPLVRGESFVEIPVIDHVAFQDATAQMALLQFDQLGGVTQRPASIHCDHLIEARHGAGVDLPLATDSNRIVYDFLESAGRRFGIDFWGPGSGIIHQVVAERYAAPGMLILGTDSHTPNAGGLSAFAVGVGGADAVDGLAGLPFETVWPKLIGVRLTGKLQGWATPKDVIIKLVGILGTAGGTNSVVEFFGPGVDSIPATGRTTICNMGAEYGATTTVFPFDERTVEYLWATERADWATEALRVSGCLRADDEVLDSPAQYFDQVIEIDLSELEPLVSGPGTPDRVRSLTALGREELESGLDEISAVHIGSCTNSSPADMRQAADVLRQGLRYGLRPRVPLFVTPGSTSVLRFMEQTGILEVFRQAGAVITTNACSACIGMWRREDGLDGKPNVIVSTFNRNFPGRNDGSPLTLSYIVSPPVAAAMSLFGSLRINPMITPIFGRGLLSVEPVTDIPREFRLVTEGFIPAPENPEGDLEIPPNYDRLARLEPFAWAGPWEYDHLPVLVRARGKCTTDHISPAGKWLTYRGHLPNISRNYCERVANPTTGVVNDTLNMLDGTRGTYHDVGLQYKAANLGWVFVGDVNVGEGSSREHAALEPRYLGCRVALARSFARIHKANLKKQGILVAEFSDPADYDLITEGSQISIVGIDGFSPASELRAIISTPSGDRFNVALRHNYTARQIDWFMAGSALNFLRSEQAEQTA